MNKIIRNIYSNRSMTTQQLFTEVPLDAFVQVRWGSGTETKVHVYIYIDVIRSYKCKSMLRCILIYTHVAMGWIVILLAYTRHKRTNSADGCTDEMADFNLNVSLLFVNLHDLRQDEMEQKEAEKLSKSKNEVGTHSSLVCNRKDQILLRGGRWC